MQKNKKRFHTLLSFLAVMVITSFFFLPMSPTPKAEASILPTFGGMVNVTFFCTCSGTWLLYIGPPVPALLVYANTPQYRWFQLPRPGIWTLGLYYPGLGICKVATPWGCVDIQNQGLISPTVGTSM